MEHQYNAMLFTVKRKRGIKPKERERRKIILLSESSQHDKATYCIIPTTVLKGKSHGTMKNLCLQGFGGGMEA